MGRFLSQYVGEHYQIRLDRSSYLFGNVLPDYCPSFLIRPHYLKNHAAHVQNILQLLLPRRSSAYDDKKHSRLLGVLCHFYADFFCYAHSDGFPGNLQEHIAYESSLNCYFMEHLEQLRSVRLLAPQRPAADADDLYRRFENLHSSYLLSHQSFGNDILYAMTACIDLIVSAAGSAEVETKPMNPCEFDSQEAI